MSRRLPLGMIFSSSRGENPINFSTLGVGAHGRSLRNRVSRRVFYDAEKEHNCQDPNILCKPITGLKTIIDVSGTLLLSEDNASATFTVRLNHAPLKNTTVSLIVDDLSEVNISHDEIVFTRDNSHRPVTVTVTGINDDIVDGTVDTFVSVKIVDEDLTNFVYIANEDNDKGDRLLIISGITHLTVDATEGNTTTQHVNFKLTANPQADMTFAATNPSDITMDKTSLTFTSENWEVEQTIIFTMNDADYDLADGDISNNIIFDNNNGDTKTITVVFSDDDILDSNINLGEGLLYEDSTLPIGVSLNKMPVSDVSLSIVSSDSARVSVSPSLLVFTPENYNATQSFVLSGIDNGILNNPELFDISLTFVNYGNDNVTYNYQKPISVTMYDSTREVFFPISSLTINEGSSVSYDLSLSTRPVNDLVVSFASGTHIQSINDVTFTNENWNLAQTITLTTNTSSQAVDQNDTLVVSTSNDNEFGSLTIPVVISNVNETAGFTLSKTTSTLTEGSTDTFTVVLTSEPSSDTTLSIANVDTTVFTDLISLVFNNTNWSDPQTVTVTTIDDTLMNGDRSDTITVSVASGATEYDSLPSQVINLTIEDNDTS